MSKFFILLAVLLIFTGALLIAVPRDVLPAATRGAATPTVTFIATARSYAEAVNAPLSILFGVISLFYSRRTYLAQTSHNNGVSNVSQRT